MTEVGTATVTGSRVTNPGINYSESPFIDIFPEPSGVGTFTAYGYNVGGYNGVNQISKFAYASNTTGSDVGNLRTDKQLPGGNNQY